MKDTWSKLQLANGYQNNVVRLHRVPKDIVSDKDARFISRFWQDLQELMGTTLKMSTAFHPTTDEQTERTIKTLEDMLRACLIYHTRIGITPFEALYGQKCRSPIFWDDSGSRSEMVQEMLDQVKLIRNKMKDTQDRQKSCADLHRRAMEFERYVPDSAHVLEVEHIELDEALTYVETPKEILDRKVRKTRNSETVLLKVLWSNHNMEEATWEAKDAMRERYPHHFDQFGVFLVERPPLTRNKAMEALVTKMNDTLEQVMARLTVIETNIVVEEPVAPPPTEFEKRLKLVKDQMKLS
ncbi:uncharacterized protein LOC141618287 [Silene latifolia]|uniref:uncharacterized protein LOC141618287 n=1 Tax=Silene latifolia TaxID=37657 RepID=UPI003D77F784